MNTALWGSVANGAIAVSYTMGREAKLPVGSTVEVTGQHLETLQVGGLGTVGIPGVDAVVSDATARSLGFPAGNAIVISAPGARLSTLVEAQGGRACRGGGRAACHPGEPGRGRHPGDGRVDHHGWPAQPGSGHGLPQGGPEQGGHAVRVGRLSPTAFDCSGLVQWSFAQAGVVMPRVAADQARTGPAVPVSQLQPGDLLFYRFDPTAPGYISHVAIYLGKGLMLQAPQPGENVEIVPVDLGSGFAGAVAVSPAVAAAAAANPLG
jgi:cell wall-associated NlpC family hydrolase